MGDALCMMMVPPTTNQEDMNQQAPTSERSSFRRSLQLSNGAFGLRRFSRASDTGDSNNNHSSQRRATISTTTTTRPIGNTLHVRIVPHIENPSRSLIFDIFDRELQEAVYIKIGRFTDRSHSPTHMSFKTKVVSRAHCEIWMEDGKLFVRDTKSSSGTFLNHIRISPPNQESQPHEIKDGDIVQLGVDYQNGVEEIYRSVKMRFEVNKTRRQRPLSFNMTAFQNIRNLTSGSADAAGNQIQEQTASIGDSTPPLPVNAPVILAQAKLQLDPQQQQLTKSATIDSSCCSSSNPELNQESNEVEECCICLYALAPLQALFVSPCAHTYHFKCIRPLLQSYPGFQCPICRTYSDLDANINLESHEVMEKYGLRRQSTVIDPASALTCITNTTTVTSSQQQQQQQQQQDGSFFNATQQQSPSSSSSSLSNTSRHNHMSTTPSSTQPNEEDPDTAPLAYITNNTRRMLTERPARDRQTVVEDDTLVTQRTNNSTNDLEQTQPTWQSERSNNHNGGRDDLIMEQRDMATSQDLHRQQRSVLVNDNVMVIPDTNMNETSRPLPTNTNEQPRQQQQQRRRASTSGFVEKLKMVFFEKRKSSVAVVPRERKRTNRPRPLSYPNFLRRHDDDEGDTHGHTDGEDNYDDTNEVVLQRSNIPPLPPLPIQYNNNSNTSSSSSSAPTSHNLSRQSTTHLAEIEEEEDNEQPWHQHFNQYQPMSVDT
ncbi:hypothetical protein BC941DRAFT_435230 [Chlamydoabsidia padenii]|nr:hypothetical protein BC941DRAFT_435230 [Chlamydoabsidia padenii]